MIPKLQHRIKNVDGTFSEWMAMAGGRGLLKKFVDDPTLASVTETYTDGSGIEIQRVSE